MNKIVVDMISESEFTVQAHGVHTAFAEMKQALNSRPDIDLEVNASRPNADITHSHTIGLYSLRKIRSSKAKKVISGHVIPASLAGSIKGMDHLQWLVRWYMKKIYSQADLVLAVSKNVRDDMIGPMGLKNRVEILYNTVDMSKYKFSQTDRIKAREKLGLDEKDFVVLGNGQVQPRKRLDMFFETAKLMPEIKFIWVGGITFKHLGASYKKKQDMVESAPKNVFVTGVISHDQVMSYLAAADVFFLPAEQENHPMCVLEAAGAGLPILLRDISEYDDTFRPDAIFVNTAADAQASILKLSEDESFYKDRQAATAKIAARFDSKAGAERLVEFYKDLLKN